MSSEFWQLESPKILCNKILVSKQNWNFKSKGDKNRILKSGAERDL